MPFFDENERDSKEIFPGVRIKTFWAEKMLASIVEFEAEAGVPMHDHPHEQCGAILEGQVSFTIEDETRVCSAGESYIIPGGVRHRAESVGGPAKVIEVFSPVREEFKY
jgi:quercetin dioxygenase-like cupin family protein